jgi:hypothetical protein
MGLTDNTPAFADDPMPPIFGSKARTKVAVILARYGPTPVRRLARVLGVDSESVFRWVALLARSGMVEKRPVGAAYPGLNRAYRLHDNVRELLLALAQKFPQPDPGVPKWRDGFSTTRMPKANGLGPEVDFLFGSCNRSRLLMLVGAAGMTNRRESAASLNLGEYSARYAIDRLVEEKMLVERRDGQHGMLSINPKMAGAEEFGRLLRCIAMHRREVAGSRSPRGSGSAIAGTEIQCRRYRAMRRLHVSGEENGLESEIFPAHERRSFPMLPPSHRVCNRMARVQDTTK